jgi:DNA-directed RNA polymerase subunit RPC12/RpoP
VGNRTAFVNLLRATGPKCTLANIAVAAPRTSATERQRLPPEERLRALPRKRKQRIMPLSGALVTVLLTMPCPHCGHKLEKVGSWFKSTTRYECAGCHQTVRVRYEDKLKLFDDHAHLSELGVPATIVQRN